MIGSPALFGRSGVLAEIRACLERASAGQSPGVLITGEAGVGRTSVLHAVMQQARADGFVVGFANLQPFHRTTPLAVQRLVTEPQPALLAVDNLTWADPESLQWLASVAGTCVVVATTARDAALREPVEDLLGLDRIELRSLDLGGVAEYLVSSGLDTDDAGMLACLEVTGGNPFLLREVVRYLAGAPADEARIRAAAPRTVSDELHGRLRQADPASIGLMRAVAVLGPDGDLPLSAQVAGLEFDDALAAADLLVAARVLDNRQPLGFVYPAVANAIRDHLPVGARIAGHVAAARGLRESGQTERVVAHLVAAGPTDLDWAAETLWEAAKGSVPMLHHALRHPLSAELRPKVLRDLGIASAGTDLPAAGEHLRAALRAATEPEQRAEIAGLLADVLSRDGHTCDAERVLNGALAGLAADSEQRGRLECARAEVVLRELPGADAVRAWLGEHEHNPWVRQIRAGLLAMLKGFHGQDRAEVISLARQVNGGVESALWCGVLALVYADELELAETLVEALEPAAVQHVRGRISGLRGQLPRAVSLLRAAASTPSYRGARVSAAWLTCALVDLGQTNEAADVVRRYSLDGPLPHRWDSGHVLYARARMRVALGELESGLEDYLACGRLLEVFEVRNPEVVPWRAGLALAYHKLGRRQQALEVAEENLRLSRIWGAQRTVGTALTTLALCHEHVRRVELLREATSVLEPTSARGQLIEALSGLGQALQREGQSREGTAFLARAASMAKASGVVALSTLTPQESRIAELASQGWTNRRISAELHLTQRTVEFHLSGVYRKLGIPGRAQLRATLERME